MTKMTVLHIGSPFAFTMPVPKQPVASVHNRDEADQVGAGGETESGDLSIEPPSSGGDRVSLLAGDAPPTRSQATVALTQYDAVLSHYRDAGAALAGSSAAEDGSEAPT